MNHLHQTRLLQTLRDLPDWELNWAGGSGTETPVRWVLDETLRQRLNQVTKGAAWAEYSLLTAALRILLWRLGAPADVVITTPALVGEQQGGPLLVRLPFEDTQSFRSVTRLQRDALNGARSGLAESRTSFEKTWADNDGGDPKALYRIVWQQAGLSESWDQPSSLHFNWERSPTETALTVTAAAELGGEHLAVSLAQTLPRFLENLLNQGDAPVSSIPLLNPDENEVLKSKNRFPESPSLLVDAFRVQITENWTAPALYAEDQILSYAELGARVDQVALCLQQEYGVTPGTRVALWGRRDVDFVVTMWAVLQCGASWLALDPSYPEERLAFMLADGNVSLLLGLPETVRLDVPPHCRVCRETAPLAKTTLPFTPVTISTEDEAYLIYTSGSTGRPKGVPIHHGALATYIRWASATYRQNQPCGFAWFTTPAFDLTITSLFLPLCHGDSLVVYSDQPAEQLVAAVFADPRVTLVKLTPAHVGLIPKNQATSVQRAILGGEALLPHHVRRLRGCNPDMHIFNEYGPTETTVGCTVAAITDPDVITIGAPADHITLAVLDDFGHALPTGFRGELHIGGVTTTVGYLNRPELNQSRFRTLGDTRFYRSGDVVSLGRDGNLHYHGRNDFQLKINGFRIEAGEIERCLTACEGVHEAVVVALTEDDNRRVLAAYVGGPGAFDETPLREAVADALPLYMMPAYIIPLAELPLTRNGKIDRDALPAPQRQTQGQTPGTAQERLLRDAFAAVFPKKRITTGADFFALGGDSIKALQIVASVHEAGYALAVGDLFREPRLAQLAQGLQQLKETVVYPPMHGAVPATPAQIHFRRSFAGNRGAYNQSILLTLPTRISEHGLNAVVRMLQEQHELLRAVLHPDHEDHLLIQDTYATPQWCDLQGTDNVRDQLQDRAAADQRDFDLFAGPLLRVTCFRCDDADRLLLAAHHLVVDGVSWRLILETLNRLFQQQQAGQPLKPAPRGPGLEHYAAWLAQTFSTSERRRRQAYWQTALNGTQPIAADLPPAGVAETRTAFLNHTWDEATTETMLVAAGKAYRTDVNDLLLTALGDALHRAERLQRVGVLLESHGRDLGADSPDLGRTVGWFTTWHPVILQNNEGSARERLTAVKETLRAVSHAGIDYSLLDADDELRVNKPEIAFNYLGRFDEDTADPNRPRFSDWDIGPEHEPSDPPPFAWFFSGMVVNGRLQLNLAYDQQRFRRSRMERLHQTLIQAIEDLVAESVSQPRTWLSPADVPLAGLSAAQLEPLQQSREIEALYPLSPMQQGLLFHHQQDGDAYLEQIGQVLRGRVDEHALQGALRRVLHDAEIGRTVFFPDAPGQALQGLLTQTPVEPVRVTVADETEADTWMTTDRTSPFDLTAGPPLRISLLHVGSDQVRLVWTFHHILMDGWCLPLLFGAVIDHYRRLRRGDSIQPRPVPPFRRYIAWLNDQDQQAGLAWWRRMLQDHHKTPIATHGDSGSRRDSLELHWSAEDSAALERKAAEERVTANHIIQVLWGYLVARENYSNEALFGAVVSGRPPSVPGVNDMIGLFINTIPVRIHFDVDTPLRAVLHQRRDDAVTAEQVPTVPLAQLQQGTPLFDHILVFENYPEGDAAVSSEDGLQLDGVLAHEQTHYPLTLVVVPDTQYLVRADYDPDRISPTKVRRLLDDMKTLLRAWIAQPNLTPADPWQKPKSPVVNSPQTETDLLTAFTGQVRANGDNVAVRAGDDVVSYQQLADRVAALAAHLRNTVQLEQGDRVAVALPQGPGLLQALLATLYCGAAYVPLDPEAPAARTQGMLADAGVRITLTNSAIAEHLGLEKTRWLDPNSLNEAGAQPFQPLDVPDDTAAYMIYTSGSTGKPKGVVVTRGNLAWYMARARELYFDQDPAADMALFTATTFDLTVTSLFSPLVRGAAVVVPPGNGLDEHINAVFAPGSGIHAVKMTPAHVALLEAHQTTDVSVVILGGEALRAEVVASLRRLNPTMRIFNEYGPTETTVGCLVAEIGDGPITIGRPMTGVNAAVWDRWGRALDGDQQGELVIGGAGVAKGYHQRPELTDRRFVEARDIGRCYRTGDLVRRDESGVFHFLGRIDQQLSLRGFRIEAGEVEQHLTTTAGIHEALVDVVEGERGPRLTAWLRGEASLDSLRSHLSRYLPSYMIPEAWVFVDHFPLTANGKVDRNALPAPVFQRGERRAENHRERLLSEIWAAILGQDQLEEQPLSIDDDFFALGGDSIKALQIRARLRRAGYDLDLKDLFREGTIARLAPLLKRDESRVHRAEAGPTLLSPIQTWFLAQNRKQPQHYNQSLLWRLPAQHNPDQVTEAWRVVLDHHRLPLAKLAGGRLVVDSCGDFLHEQTIAAGEAEGTAASLQSRFNLSQGPLMQIVLLREPEATFLFACAHHLVIDGVSWRILLEDFHQAHTAITQQETPMLDPVPTSFGDWTLFLHEEALSQVAREQSAYWRGLHPWRDPVVATTDTTPRVADQVRQERVLTPTLSRTLLGPIHQRLGTEMNDILLTGLVAAFQGDQHQGPLAVTLEGHGRESDRFDLSRTVGWFTDLFPVVFAAQPDADAGDLLAHVKETLRAVPAKGGGYGLLKFVGGEPLPDLPRVLFNYLGRFSGGTDLGEFHDAGPEEHADESVLFDYGFGAGVSETEDGPVLNLFLDHQPARVSTARAQQLLDRFASALSSLAAAEPTRLEPLRLHDIPFAGMNQNTLDRINTSGPVQTVYPATPMQAGLLFQADVARESGDTAYVSQLRLRLNRQLDETRLGRALTELHSRHAVLRTSFVQGDRGTSWQVVHPGTEVTPRLLDLRGLAEPRNSLNAFASAERQRCAAPESRTLSHWARVFDAEPGELILWTFHHALLDGWSVGLVLSELVQLYADNAHLPARPASRDYLLWLADQREDQARSWWQSYLGDGNQATHLPLAVQESDGWAPRVWTAEEGADRLTALVEPARRWRTTLNHLCSAVWVALLARLGEQRCVTFGAVANGRPAELAGSDDMVGLFLTTLPVQVTLQANDTIATIARRLQDTASEREPFQYLAPSEINALSPVGPDLINNLVVFESYPVPKSLAPRDGDLRFETIDVEEWNHYDLSLVIVPGEQGGIRFEYNGARFAESDVVRLSNLYCDWLAALVEHIDQPINHYVLPTEAVVPRPAALPTVSVETTLQTEVDSVVQTMTALWHEVLDGSKITPETSFFAAGGHSLAAARLNALIQERFGVRLPMRAVFTHPTVAGLSECVRLEQAQHNIAERIQPVAEAAHYPLSPAQQRIWILARLDETGMAYNMPTAVTIEGELDARALRRAFADVIARHEILRTRFPEVEAAPVQIIEAPGDVPFQCITCGKDEITQHLQAHAEQVFDVAMGPLLHALLLQIDPNHHIFALNLHHLLGDAWSMDLLVREVLDRYEAHRDGKPEPLPAKRLQFKDVAAWLRARADEQHLAQARGFWLEHLAEAPAPVSLPSDRPRPLLASHRGDRVMLAVPRDLGPRLVAFATEHQVTPFCLLVTALNLLLQRFNESRDLIVGTPVANREHADLADQLGVFINTLPLRNRLEPGLPFRDLIAEVQRNLEAALAHQSYPFDALVEALQGAVEGRDHAAHAALFDVMVSFVQQADSDQSQGGLTIEPVESPFRTSKLDLSFDFVLGGNELLGSVEYNSDLYDPATVARYGRWLVTLLEQLTAEPNRPVALVSMLDAADHEQLQTWSQGPAPVLAENSVCSVLDNVMRHHPEAVALRRDDQSWTYAALDQRADSIASALQRSGRLKRGDVVAVALARNFDLPAAMLAIWRLGGVYLPLATDMPTERLRRILAEAKTRVLLTEENLAEGLRDHRYRTVTPPAGDKSGTVTPVELKGDDPAYLIFTSGSTGKPKGVLVEHGALAHTIGQSRINFGFGKEDRMPWVAPQAFDISLFELLVPLCSGATVDILSREQVLDLDRLAHAFSSATAFHAVPHLLDRLLDHLPPATSSSGPRVLFTGGDRVPPALLARCAERFPTTRLVELYGPTEATIICTAWEVNRPAESETQTAAWRGACIGRPLPGVSLALRDEHGALVAPGAVGELTVAGPGLARGYWRNPRGTEAVFVRRDGARYYRTGDRARFLPDGNLAFLGRGDEQVQVRGFRVEPGEVAAVLAKHPSVRAAVVQKQGDQLAAWLECLQPENGAALRAYARTLLPEYMVPERWFVLDAFPLNRNGKVDRDALFQMTVATEVAEEPSRRSARNPAEQALTEIWAEVLGHDRFGIDDHFADVGGHSLEVTRLAALIQQRMGRKVGIRALFSEPTIAALAESEFTDWQNDAQTRYLPTVPDADDYPVSAAQTRLWLLNRMPGGARAHTIPLAMSLEGSFNKDAFAAALQDIVTRHEVMRTVFLFTDQGLRQKVLSPEEVTSLEILETGPLDEAAVRHHIQNFAAKTFDLEAAPAWQASLLLLGSDQAVLMLNLHHILSDAWSLDLFIREWQTCYQSRVQGETPRLSPLPYQQRDYAAWEQSQLQNGGLIESERYWQTRFADWRPQPALLLEKAGTPTEPYRCARFSRHWSASFRNQVQNFAKKHHCSVFTVLLAAVKTLYFRTTGTTDVTLGLPFALRDVPGSEAQLGYFGNTLPLRTQFSEDLSFGQLVDAVGENLQTAQQHAAYPFDQLVARLKQPRRPDRHPLFDCMVKFEKERRAQVATPIEPTLSAIPVESETGHFDLTLSFHDLDEGLVMTVEYHTRFDEGRMDQLADNLEALLRDGLSDAGPLGTLQTIHEVTTRTAPSTPKAHTVDIPADVCLEDGLLAIWSELLELPPTGLGVGDDFFEAGGSSITVAALDHRVRQRFGVHLPFDTWFRLTTVREQAAALAQYPVTKEKNG